MIIHCVLIVLKVKTSIENYTVTESYQIHRHTLRTSWITLVLLNKEYFLSSRDGIEQVKKETWLHLQGISAELFSLSIRCPSHNRADQTILLELRPDS